MKNKYLEKGMKKLLGMAMITTMTVSLLTGCKLASDETASIEAVKDREETNTTSVAEGKVAQEDMLVGIILSIDDLFMATDLDFTEEEIMDIIAGEDVEVYKPKVEGNRIYATKKEMTDENGEKYTDYVFEGCRGVLAFRYNVMGEDGKILYESDSVGNTHDYTGDMQWDMVSSDEKKEYSLTGNFYLNKIVADKIKTKEEEVFVYKYLIYQTKAGEVYIDETFSIEVLNGYETRSWSEEVKVTLGDEEFTYKCNIELATKIAMPADKTIVRQMNENKEVIGSVEIDNTNIPESLDIDEETKFVVVEEYISDEIVYRYMVDMKYGSDSESVDEESMSIAISEKNEDSLFINKAFVKLVQK